MPIVTREERSEAARAFQKLAETYADEEREHVAAPEPVVSDRGGKRRFAWRS